MKTPSDTFSTGTEPSCFAPAERTGMDTLRRQQKLLGLCPLSSVLLGSGASNVLILNEYRQIVAAGRKAMELLSAESLETLLGKRPGEAANCTHADNCTGGCGTSSYCKECGAARSIMEAIGGKSAEQECRLLANGANGLEALDLRITTTPFVIENTKFVILALSDISHEKRRQALERVFFHDVLNLAGGISGLLELVKVTERDQVPTLLNLCRDNIDDLIETVRTQRDLHAAERNELSPKFERVSSIHLLLQVISTYQAHAACKTRTLHLAETAQVFELRTDPSLFKRVIGNLLKNASEASPQGAQVTVSCSIQGALGIFSVHNDGVMPPDIQSQIFMRSFSTKGPGRGLGTYSVRLFTEKYLEGKVNFVSEPSAGTIFTLSIPLERRS